MAIQPIPDNAPEHMYATHGTMRLITDPRADYYLSKSAEYKKNQLRDRKIIMDSWTI